MKKPLSREEVTAECRLLVTNEHIGPGYDLWSNQTVSYEGAGLYSAHLWAQKAREKLKELAGSESPWLVQVSFTSWAPTYQAPDRFMELYDRPDNKEYSEVRSRSLYYSHV